MQIKSITVLSAIVLGLAVISGCDTTAPVEVSGNPPAIDGHAAHSEEGPHGGHLIELGRNHEYHAELVESDAAQTVTIFILDGNMKELAIAEPTISLALTADDESKTFELRASAEAGSTGSSKFVAADAGLFQMLEEHGDATGKLRVSINGTPYVGALDHRDHEDGHKH